jgi:hypothetical protein
MSNGYAVKYTAWRAALWWLAPPLVAAIMVVLPRLVSRNPFTMASFESVTHANGKWVLEHHESGKYLFRHDGRLYRTSCMGASTDQVFREDCDSILPFKGQELEGTLSEGRLLLLRKKQPIFQVEAIEDRR